MSEGVEIVERVVEDSESLKEEERKVKERVMMMMILHTHAKHFWFFLYHV